MSRTLRLAVQGPMAAAFAAELEQRFPSVTLVRPTDADVQALAVWDIDINGVVSALECHARLEWIHLRWAGVPPAVLEALGERPMLLTNGSGAHGVAIAEYVVGTIIAHCRRFHELRAAQERAEWLTNVRVRELRGQTVGIVGLGDLGLATARMLRPFGVQLRGLRRSPAPCPEVDRCYKPEELAEFLTGLDVVVVAAPLTSDTRGLIGADELGRLNPGAFLVNVGRGPVVDEQALIAALQGGQLSGAALDVFVHEPLPAESPLWRLPGVFISPHCSDASPQSLERGFALFADNLDRFVRGQPLTNVVDRQAGY